MPNENSNYYSELTHNLKHAGFTVSPEGNNLLPIKLDGQPLCCATESGGVRWQHSDIDDRRSALDTVIAITKTTHEYMRQIEAAPKLTADGLEGDYRLLSEFNGTVLAGHPTEYGVQFITWERTHNHTGLWQGHYIGPGCGIADYTAAKQDFAVRSGLIHASALFTPEQLTELYRSIDETLENICITPERQKLLESAEQQIKLAVPDLDERCEISMQMEEEYDTPDHQKGGYTFLMT